MRISNLVVAALFIFGICGVANSAPVLSLDVDFYGGSTSLTKGVFDTGETVELVEGGSVIADFYFSISEEGLEFGSFDISYNMSTLNPSNCSIASPFTGSYECSPGEGNVYGLFETNPAVGPGDNIHFLTFTFTGINISDPLDSGFIQFSDMGPWITESGLDITDQIDREKIAYITVSPELTAPIPGTIIMLGSGLLIFLGINTKNRKRKVHRLSM